MKKIFGDKIIIIIRLQRQYRNYKRFTYPIFRAYFKFRECEISFFVFHRPDQSVCKIVSCMYFLILRSSEKMLSRHTNKQTRTLHRERTGPPVVDGNRSLSAQPIWYLLYNIFVDYGNATNKHVTVHTGLAESTV